MPDLYAREGRSSRPPVVFVHGFIGHLRSSAEAVRNHWQSVLAPDLLGYGSDAKRSPSSVSLETQVEEVIGCINRTFGNDVVDLVGHSVGGAIAMLVAAESPSIVRRIVNVEGNFTLEDAFWSASVGRMTPAEAESMLADFRAEPASWLTKAGLEVTDANLDLARDLLGFQPADTLRAMGRSIIDVTGAPNYLARLKSVFEAKPVYLFAGERSLSSWHVPDWALVRAAELVSIRGVGHLMMIERPGEFTEELFRVLS